MSKILSPAIDPHENDVFKKWNQVFRIDSVNQGLVHTTPNLGHWRDHNGAIGISFFRQWAEDAEIIHAEPRDNDD